MKIYDVTGYLDGNRTHYFAATMKEARALRRQLHEDGHTLLTIAPFYVGYNRAGVAKALNSLLDLYCVNEH